LKYQGKVWRHIPAGAHPLHVFYILKANGRWNRTGEYGCLYTSLTPEGAIAEYDKHLLRFGAVTTGKVEPHELVSLIVEIDPVIDLTDVGTSPISPEASFLIGDDPKNLEACRSLADSLRAQGYAGLIIPSAAAAGKKNLIIYIDSPEPIKVLEDGGDRVPIIPAL